MMARLEQSASLPPFNMQAFPLFQTKGENIKTDIRTGFIDNSYHSERNADFCQLSSHWGEHVSFNTLPKGEGSVATLRVSAAMPFKRSSVNFNRSYFGSFLSIRARSFSFSARMKGVSAIAASATAFKI